MDTSKYKALYLSETNEHISGIERGLLALEKAPGDDSAVDSLFRHYHSIKGMSASMGYEPIKRLAHVQEDLLDRIRSKRLAATQAVTTVLLNGLDGLRALLGMVSEDKPFDLDVEPLVKNIRDIVEGAPASGVETKAVQAEKRPAPAAPAEAESKTTAPSGEGVEPELKLSNIMKVEGRVFDDLLTTVGDLFMVLSSFKSLSHALRSITFKDGVFLLGKTINKLHQNILSARMLPIRDLTENLPRIIRDISVKSGKSIDLKVFGDDISLDRTILENLSSPIVHIIRNSVDHGIETPAERQKAGKDPVGVITINAYTKIDKVVISISDDGKGIDVEKVKAKAAQKGVRPEELATMSDKAAMMLVCLPGLSAAEKVTETSGRGVGMDIVKSVVEGLGGSLKIDSVYGKGISVTMEMPRTTAIIKTLLVNCGDEIFLAPISMVRKVLEVGTHEIMDSAILYDGESLPVINLGDVLGLDNSSSKREVFTVIVTEWHDRGIEEAGVRSLVGIQVDDFGDEIDAYIKPLLPPMSKLWGASGITIMGDGRPVFLLDLPAIIAKAFASA